MAKTIKISNATNRYIETKYRMPQGMPISITVQPRALLNEINFPNEECYTAWKLQNKTFFDRGILLENEKNDKLLKANGQEDAKGVTAKIQTKVDNNLENVSAAADNVNASLTVETEDLRERKGRRK